MEYQKIETVTVGINNTGGETVVVRTIDGTLTVRPGAKLKNQPILPLTEEQVDLYKSKGVKFTGLPKNEPKDEPDISALEKTATDAKAEYLKAQAASQKQGAGEAEKKALQDATDKLTAAEQALSGARQ